MTVHRPINYLAKPMTNYENLTNSQCHDQPNKFNSTYISGTYFSYLLRHHPRSNKLKFNRRCVEIIITELIHYATNYALVFN